MHRDLKSLLHDAKGFSEFVVAINLDVRGFSSWLKESSEAALFLKRLYLKVLDEYFPNATFFSLTGDGLMISLTYEDDTLKEVVTFAVKTSMRIVREFPELFIKDPMINFDVPKHVGIGISRGAATRLVSGEKTLDFSGRPLNQASRLMDLARPTGVVFDHLFVDGVLPKTSLRQFKLEEVYIRSMAEREPISIYCSKDVELPNTSKQPIDRGRWNEETIESTMGDLSSVTVPYIYKLKSYPSDPGSITARVEFPRTTRSGKRRAESYRFELDEFKFIDEAGKPHLQLDYPELSEILTDFGVKKTWPVKIRIIYRVD